MSAYLSPAFFRIEFAIRAQGANSPTQRLAAIFDRRLHAVPDGLAHARNRQKEQCLLDSPPVVLGDEDGARTLVVN